MLVERIMLFIDGDNLLARFQAGIRAGRVKADTVSYQEDWWAWCLDQWIVPLRHNFNIIRASFYLSVSGDDDRVAKTAAGLRTLHACQGNDEAYLFPRVFKKAAGSQKAKAIDTQLAVDAVSQVLDDNLDILYLLSGDGDFAPVLDVAIRAGKKVWVGAFTDGLSSRLAERADVVVRLENLFFKPEAPSPA